MFVVKHSCDEPLCANPLHLELGTQSENVQETYDRGGRKPPIGYAPRKLTADKALEIRSKEGLTNVAIAAEYGISPSMVGRIRNGHSWVDI